MHCNLPPLPDRLVPLKDFLADNRPVAGLIRSADLLTSGDSNDVTLCVSERARAIKTESVGIFGPVSAGSCLEWGSKDGDVLQKDVAAEMSRLVSSNPSNIPPIENVSD